MPPGPKCGIVCLFVKLVSISIGGALCFQSLIRNDLFSISSIVLNSLYGRVPFYDLFLSMKTAVRASTVICSVDIYQLSRLHHCLR
jgi:hypothetical protein